jgi:uncharacterized protein CbrC (UPF0167 family)
MQASEPLPAFRYHPDPVHCNKYLAYVDET